jgi:hypothetical protein
MELARLESRMYCLSERVGVEKVAFGDLLVKGSDDDTMLRRHAS